MASKGVDPVECEDCGAQIGMDEPAHLVESDLPPLELPQEFWTPRYGIGVEPEKRYKSFDDRFVCDQCWKNGQALRSRLTEHAEEVLSGTDGNLPVRVISGKIEMQPFHDGEALAVCGEFLAEFLEQFKSTQVWAVFGFSDEPLTPGRMAEVAVEIAAGVADAMHSAAYSEVTGFLWVNDEGKIGGHDMIRIFGANEGKYGCLVVSTAPVDLWAVSAEGG